MTEKLRREDVEACPSPEPIEFSRSSRRRQWRAAFLLASALAATAVVFAAIGLVTGLGVVRSGESLGDGCSVSAGDEPAVSGDVTAPENTKVEPQQLSATKCPLHPSPSPLPSPLPEKIVAAISTLETQLETLLNDQTMPGLVASVTYREEDIWSKGFGVTRKRVAGKTPDKDTIYRIASVSKIFVVLMVYQMYDRGLIRSLDDPLNYFCPTFHINNPFTADNITLRQIMSSMSGLPREAPCGQPEEPSVNLCPHNTSAILGRLSRQSTILPPWTQPSYSNLGFALLGRCLVSHFFPETSYEDYLQLHILDPLGMAGTGFTYSSHSVLGRLATGYESDGSAEPLYDVGWWGPAGQMHSTASDLNKLGKFFYSTGETDNPVYSSVLSASLRRLMLLPSMQPVTTDTADLNSHFP
jgi:CubicO group peptidase (beta-lactamase class C family)